MDRGLRGQTMEKETVLQVSDLSFSYPGGEDQPETVVFEHLNLSVEAGSFVAVLGHNGCGKSTLAKQFNAVLLPCGGTVTAYGMDTKDEDLLLEIRRRVGMVFQNPDNQIVSSVVEEDVAFAPENLGVEPEEIRRRVDSSLRLVGMEQFVKHAPHMLSGGLKQRIAIAGVLAMHPKCIVLDEPTAMLDPQGRQEVMQTILRLKAQSGVTVVLITHHMTEAAMADRVVVMSEGKLLADGTPGEVFSQVELLRSVHLTVPETTGLLYALQCEGFDLPLDALTVDECAQALRKLLEA